MLLLVVLGVHTTAANKTRYRFHLGSIDIWEKHQSIGLLPAKNGLNRWIFSRCTLGVPGIFAVRSGF